MPSPLGEPGSLRERKRQRTADAVRTAALELFAERGYDEVTVADIAERAEVGRTTFFRYFGDKQEVLFSDTEEELAAAIQHIPRPAKPIGESVPAALRCARLLVLTFVDRITSDRRAYRLHQQLVSQHPELRARSLEKQRGYAARLAAQLTDWGAEADTATLAAEIGLACFYAGQAAAGDDPRLLTPSVGDAFDRLIAPGRRTSAPTD